MRFFCSLLIGVCLIGCETTPKKKHRRTHKTKQHTKNKSDPAIDAIIQTLRERPDYYERENDG